jgi:hypothetical protein
MELTKDPVNWRALLSALSNLRVLLPKDLGYITCRWIMKILMNGKAQVHMQWLSLVLAAMNHLVHLPES